MSVERAGQVLNPVAVAPVDRAEMPRSQAVPRVELDAGPAVTWWVSPPGQFFSILHRFGERYPIELTTALASFAEAAPATQIPASSPFVAQVAQSTPSMLGVRGGYTPSVPPPVATTDPMPGPLGRLFATLLDLAARRPAVFQDVAGRVADSVYSVAVVSSAAGAGEMVTLASELQQSVVAAAGATPFRAVSPADRAELAPVGYVPPIEGSLPRGRGGAPG